MATKLGRNDRCPCGSGKKVKKCCGVQPAPRGYTVHDREALFGELDFMIDEQLAQEEEDAYEVFWGRFHDREDELGTDLLNASNDVQFAWFACDYMLDDGVTPLERLLAEHPHLTLGARAFAEQLRASSMGLYQVTGVVPGVSLTLRNAIEGGELITVAERTASLTVNQFDWLAARVIAKGPSGKPEIERGVLPIPRMLHDDVHAELKSMRQTTLRSGNLALFRQEVPPFLHGVWVSAILAPRLPALQNTDGEPLLITREHFQVIDRALLARALDADEALSCEDNRWHWSGLNAQGTTVTLGTLELTESSLVLEANSQARAERGRALVNQLAGKTVRHRATTHEDLEQQVRERITARATGKLASDDAAEPDSAIPPEIAEALVLDHYAKHYRAWVDQPVPALDGQTPRAAAKQSALRARLVELIEGLQSSYQYGLRHGEPAYDPSWMWVELSLQTTDEKLPPPLAHERLAHHVDGAAAIVADFAESVRSRPGFDDASTLLDADTCRESLDLKRFLQRHPGDLHGTSGPSWKRRELLPYLQLALNFALHRRKVFWVDESLAYMLGHTDVDIEGRELRAPFPSFALVFTDRHTLSLGERLLCKRPDCALGGLILRVLTAYVVARTDAGSSSFDICFAFDALGDDLPELVHHSLALTDDTKVQTLFPQDDRVILLEPSIKTTSPLHGLLQVIVNSVLYATSSGVAPELRSRATPSKSLPKTVRSVTSENVYYLPGTIEISEVQRLQALGRVGEGQDIMRRCMVRGHWRRPANNWSDQRVRWIAPYWKGPDMAAVVERAYRLKP